MDVLKVYMFKELGKGVDHKSKKLNAVRKNMMEFRVIGIMQIGWVEK